MAENGEPRAVEMLTVQDNEGHYYMIPLEVVRLGRVPDEHAELIAQLQAANGDVSGFFIGADLSSFFGSVKVSPTREGSSHAAVAAAEARTAAIMRDLARAADAQAALLRVIMQGFV